MYERNAIVLERYFEKLFNLKNKSNLIENYLNYRHLLENYEKYSLAIIAENKATEEFKQVSNELTSIQKEQEKLYNKGAKFEYSRYIIFNNIQENPEEIRKYLAQVENDIEKNNEVLKLLGEKYVNKVIEYNDKKSILDKCQKENAEAKDNYDEILEKTQSTFFSIHQELLTTARVFVSSENKDVKKELINIFEENGKEERNQFDPDVILNAVTLSIEIYKAEMEIYLLGIDRTNKLLNEIDANSVKLDKHKKYYNDSKAKIDFLNAEKEYLFQFLDNERIAAIYDKKTHRKLMLEACRNFNTDLEQINKLFDLILKEISGRSTKRVYKENYNKEYLINLENNSIDSAQIKANSVAVMNLNYWRIEGIRVIYEVFDKVVTEIYHKDLSEFNPTIENNKEKIEETVENNSTSSLSKNETIEEDNEIETDIKCKRLTSSKQKLANAIYISLQKYEISKNKKEIDTQKSKINDKEYFDLDAKIAELDLLDDEENETENSILDDYFKEQDQFSKKRKIKDAKKIDEEINKSKKKGILGRIVDINSRSKREA